MKIYELGIVGEACRLRSLDDNIYKKIDFEELGGYLRKIDKNILNKVEYVIDLEEDPNCKLLDFLGLTGELILTEKVYNSELLKYFEETGEVLELNMSKEENYPGIKLWLYNILYTLDCVDLEKSECDYYPHNGELAEIEKYVFDESKIPKETNLFSIPNFGLGEPFLVVGNKEVEKDFYFLYHKLGFTGLKFTEIYRTPGEKDFDVEATVEALKRGEKLEKPVYKKGFLGIF